MSGLTDMEELLARINDKSMVDYMREALVCYHGGAYRGCIVLSYIALFDDLSEKLHELAKTNKAARNISKEVKKRQSEQKIFESYMVDQLKSENLLTEPESSMLEQVRVCRNKAAHPSGVHASAEEARFVFFEVIDKFLSRPLLLTTQAVDALIGRLTNTNFFPSSDIKETKDIVQAERANLHDVTIPYLIEQLVQTSNDSNESLRRNAQRFLVGLAYLQDGKVTTQICKSLVKTKVDDSQFGNLIVRVASADPAVLSGHNKTTNIRLRSVLDAALENSKPSVAVTQLSHPLYVLTSMINTLGEEWVLEHFDDFAKKAVEKYRYSGSLVKLLDNATELKNVWFSRMKEDAGSHTFDTANRFASNMPDIDALMKEVLKPKEALELIVAVCEAADVGAFTSQDLRAGKFSAVPVLREMAREYTQTYPSAASKVLKKLGVDVDGFIAENLE